MSLTDGSETLGSDTSDDEFQPEMSDVEDDAGPEEQPESPFIRASEVPSSATFAVHRNKYPQPSRVSIVHNDAKGKVIVKSLAEEGIKPYNPNFDYFLFESNGKHIDRGFLRVTDSSKSMKDVRQGKNCNVILLTPAADRMRLKVILQKSGNGKLMSDDFFETACRATYESTEAAFFESHEQLDSHVPLPLVSYATAVSVIKDSTKAKKTNLVAGKKQSTPGSAKKRKRPLPKSSAEPKASNAVTETVEMTSDDHVPPQVKPEPIAKKARVEKTQLDKEETPDKIPDDSTHQLTVTYTGSAAFVSRVVSLVQEFK